MKKKILQKKLYAKTISGKKKLGESFSLGKFFLGHNCHC